MSDPTSDNVLLEVRGVSKAFPGVKALKAVDLRLERGEVHVLVGENGAGKSTLIKMLSGVHTPDEGELYVGGRLVSEWNARLALEAGVSTIYQEFTLAPDMTVAENIFMGREPSGGLPFLRDRRRLRSEAVALISEFDFSLDPDSPVRRLGVAHLQMTEILKALSLADIADERVIILDEPTSALSENEAENLFTIIDRLKSRGVGMLYVTHRLDEITRIGDCITVMRDGRVVAPRVPITVERGQVIEWMVGRKLKDLTQGVNNTRPATALAISDFSFGSRVKNISFEVRQGEVVALFGLVGSGRTELVRAIIGADKGGTGEIRLGGAVVALTSPAAAIRRGVGLSPEDRKRSGIVPGRSVKDNVTLASLDMLTRWGPVIDRRRVGEWAGTYVQRLGVRTPTLESHVGTLSGGNQQKVILARLLSAEVSVLILDEPTRGIDVGARRDVYEIVNELTASGVGVLMVSSDLDEVLAMANRIIVVSQGRITGERTASAVDRNEILHLAFSK